MSSTIGGVRIVDMPDLGAVNDTSSMVGERAGSGRFSAPALKSYTSVGLAPAVSVPGLNAKSYGATGNGVTDDTAALQAAINAAVAAQQMLYIPGGRYLISVALTITRGVRIMGAYAEPQVTMFGGTPNTGGAGTWLVLDGTHLVSAFYINPTGTPSANNQATGVEISHLGIYHKQPALGAGWAPAAYPPAIDIPAGSDINLHDLCLLNPTVAIRANGQSAGRLIIERVCGQPLTTGIYLDNQTDTVVVRDVHFWVYWTVDANVLAWQNGHLFALQLFRVDAPVIDCFVCLWAWVGIQIQSSPAGHGDASVVRFTNCDIDECVNPMVIGPSNNVTVFMTGCLLGGASENAPVATDGLTFQTGALGAQVFMSSCLIQDVGVNCVNIAAGDNCHVRLAACLLFNWDMMNAGYYCLQGTHTSTIRADAATLTFSANSNTKVLAGGQCIKAPAFWMTHGVMAAGTTSQVLPHLLDVVPTMILVSPEGGPSAATEWWGTADATNVTIQVNVAPATNVNFGALLGVEG